MRLLLRLSLGILLFAGLLMSLLPPNEREPSEADMRVAVARWFGDVHEPMRFIAERCATFREMAPRLPLERTCPGSLELHLGPAEVRQFRKIGCARPNESGHSLCTFTAHFRSPDPNADLTGWPRQGFFTQQTGSWRFVLTIPQPAYISELRL